MIRKMNSENQVDPYDRPNAMYQNVPAASGDSDNGTPLEFIKVNHLRFSRHQFAFAVTAFLLGAVFILLESPLKNEFLAPGPLSSYHAQLLSAKGAERCAACHDTGGQGLTDWVSNAFRSRQTAGACQSTRCLECHKKSLDELHALKPHGIAPEILRKVSAGRIGDSFFSNVLAPTSREGDLACNTCHREHHGNSDLSALTDRQCQTCHSQQYSSFEYGHPEFTNWPQRRRQRIAFDHVSHMGDHFPAAGETFDCNSCHVDDGFQNVKLLANYEEGCARCHDKSIQASSDDGLVLIQLPMLDLSAIGDLALSVGQWPESATGDFDGRIPELMRLLLFKSPAARSILKEQGDTFEFGDLDPEDANDVKVAVELAWAIKDLMYELANNGVSEVRNRMEFAFQRSLTEKEFRELAQGLDNEVFARTAKLWLPNLESEVLQHRESNSGLVGMIQSQSLLRYFQDDAPGMLATNPLQKLYREQAVRDSSPSAAGSETVQPQTIDRPSTTLPKKMDSNWLTGEPLVDGPQSLATNPIARPNLSNRAETNRRRPSDQTALEEPQVPKRMHRQASDEELLVENPIFQRLQRQRHSSVGRAKDSQNEQEIVQRSQEEEMANAFVEAFAQAEKAESARHIGIPAPSPGQAEIQSGPVPVQAPQSGWFRDDQIFKISYSPQGHSDPLLTTLMSAVAQTPRSDSNPATTSYFKKMTSAAAIGKCFQCHTVDALEGEYFQVNWRPQYREPFIRSFTNFSHRPHLTHTQLQDCSECHAMDNERLNADSFTHFNAEQAVSNFHPITKMNCTGCHSDGSKITGCTTCHGYHIGSRVLFSQ